VSVRGVGDIGSAVVRRRFIAGYAVVVHDGEPPTTTPRGMAFADAIFDGRATLDGIAAVHHGLPRGGVATPADRRSSPVVIGGFNLVRPGAPDVLVEAHAKT
jgi:hypothetical protein